MADGAGDCAAAPAAVRWEVVVLSGGRGSRLGGVVKADLDLDGRPLLDRLLASLPPEVAVTVAGPVSSVERAGVTFCREEPAFSGPVAGLAAALAHVKAPVVVLLGADMPDAGVLAGVLADALIAHDAADAMLAVDGTGTRQPLCAAYRLGALRAALADLGDPANQSMRALVGALDAGRVENAVLSVAQQTMMTDIDTDDDLRAARSRQGSTQQTQVT